MGNFANTIAYQVFGNRIQFYYVDILGLNAATAGVSGAVDNPLNVLVALLARLTDSETGRVAIPGFYDRVLPLDEAERALIARVPINDELALYLTGAPAPGGERGYSLAERIAVRPTLDIHGIAGGFVGEGEKTVIPASATAKLSMRLVPDQEPDEIARLCADFLHSLAPPTVRLDVRTLGTARPAVVDYTAPAVRAAALAYERGFGRPPVYIRGGGSLPIVRDLQEELDVPVVMIGFGLPDDHTHAPNERLYLPNFFRGLETTVHYLNILREQ